MAQENSPDKEKRQSRTKKPEKPYVEQIDELLLVHNKNDPKEGLGVVSKADRKGNYQTVAPEEKNENSFLKFDKNSSILENFIKNFWSQLKEPTHFRLIRMTFNDYKQNKQALKDLAEGKKTDAVKEFLKRVGSFSWLQKFLMKFSRTLEFLSNLRKEFSFFSSGVTV